jgi:hypothetical protein
MLAAAALPLRPRAAVACVRATRAFKTKASAKAKQEQMSNAEDKASKGKDPYGLFKSAIMSVQEKDAKKTHMVSVDDWTSHRGAYSREKMHEHQRVSGHFTKMIRARDAALDALPEALQAEARAPDFSLLPIERRVFTETAPIPNFQDKLVRSAASD